MKATEQHQAVTDYAVQGGSRFSVCGGNSNVLSIQMKVSEQLVLSCGAFCYTVQGGPNFSFCG